MRLSSNQHKKHDGDSYVAVPSKRSLAERPSLLKSGLSQPVGKKMTWGLYDTHGNVMEWCSDWAGEYPEGAVSDPTGPNEANSRMFRGSAWLTGAVGSKSGCRAFHFPPDTRSEYVGFRVALSSPEVSNSPEPQRSLTLGICEKSKVPFSLALIVFLWISGGEDLPAILLLVLRSLQEAVEPGRSCNQASR